MSCYRPMPGNRNREFGTVTLGRWSGDQGDALELPCGRCTGCRMDRRSEWAIRCVHEAQLYDANQFVSLDYAPEHLPLSLSLEYRHVQLWMKRLRKELRGVNAGPNGKFPIRFFLSGEYGPLTKRPHWHAILFNFRFPDQVRLMNGTFRSEVAERLWSSGRVVIGDVTPASVAYVAGYTTDKVYGLEARDHYEDVVDLSTGEVTGRRPELVSMSRRPGIGAWWYDRHRSDLFGTSSAPRDFAVHEGQKRKVPGYYWRRFCESGDPFVIEELQQARIARAAEIDPSESTVERRAVKEEAALRRIRTFSSRSNF